MADVAGPTKLSPQGGAAGVTHGRGKWKAQDFLEQKVAEPASFSASGVDDVGDRCAPRLGGAHAWQTVTECVGTQHLRLRLVLRQSQYVWSWFAVAGCGGASPRPSRCQAWPCRRASGVVRRLRASGRAWALLRASHPATSAAPGQGSPAASGSAWLREVTPVPGCGTAGPRERSHSPTSPRGRLRGVYADRGRPCRPGPAPATLAGVSHSLSCPVPVGCRPRVPGGAFQALLPGGLRPGLRRQVRRPAGQG